MSSSPAIASLLRVVALLKSTPDLTEAAASAVSRPTPQSFILDILGATPSPPALSHGYTKPWTPDQERVMDAVLTHQRIAVPAGHGVGKSRVASWLVLWYLYSHPGARVVTTAPTDRQVTEVLWAQIISLWNRARVRLPGRALQKKLEVEANWNAIGFATESKSDDFSATSFQGLHSETGHVLVILDEATGVDPDIWLGAESLGLGPNDRLLAIGNPTNPASRFREVCENGNWHVITMSCLDHPNVVHDDPSIIPGAVSKLWVDQRREEYGEESTVYKATVLGQWPDQAEDALIAYTWVDAAERKASLIAAAKAAQTHKDDGKGAALGVDIAGEGGDLTVLSLIRHGVWEIPRVNTRIVDLAKANSAWVMPKDFDPGPRAWHHGRDVMQAVRLIQAAILQYPDIRAISLDDTGLGQGVSARLRELQHEGKIPKYIVQTIDPNRARQKSVWIIQRNFGSGADDERFRDQKDELWWGLREAFRNGDLGIPTEKDMLGYRLPKGNDLRSQLTLPIYAQVNGRTEVYDKRSSRGGGGNEGIRLRIKQLPAKSPDLAHSLMLAWDAYKRLRPQQVFEPAKTCVELVNRQTQYELDRTRKRAKADRRNPWQRAIAR